MAWTSTMWWLSAVDGPLPIGDVVYGIGVTVELIGLAYVADKYSVQPYDVSVSQAQTKKQEKNKSKGESEAIPTDGAESGEKPEDLTPPGAGRRGAHREAKRKNRIPTSQQPEHQGPSHDRRGNKQPGREYDYRDSEGNPVKIRDDSEGHTFPDNPTQNRGPHFNDPQGNHYDY